MDQLTHSSGATIGPVWQPQSKAPSRSTQQFLSAVSDRLVASSSGQGQVVKLFMAPEHHDSTYPATTGRRVRQNPLGRDANGTRVWGGGIIAVPYVHHVFIRIMINLETRRKEFKAWPIDRLFRQYYKKHQTTKSNRNPPDRDPSRASSTTKRSSSSSVTTGTGSDTDDKMRQLEERRARLRARLVKR